MATTTAADKAADRAAGAASASPLITGAASASPNFVDAASATGNQRTALIAGATGLVGQSLLALLLADPDYRAVHSVGRRISPRQHPKLTQHVVNLAKLREPGTLAGLPPVDDVFIALGTTIKAAGSPAAFKAIDYDAIVDLAGVFIERYAIEAIANSSKVLPRIGVVSAMGADAQSSVFYNRTKGQMEQAVSALGFSSTVFARPSLLAGDRASLQQHERSGEQWSLRAMRLFDPLIPANYKVIDAQQVAASLLHLVKTAGPGVTIALSGQLRKR